MLINESILFSYRNFKMKHISIYVFKFSCFKLFIGIRIFSLCPLQQKQAKGRHIDGRIRHEIFSGNLPKT